MKKFQNLGTALSREQSKKIKGGDECLDCGGGGGGTFCSEASSCSYYESGTGNVTGTCVKNSNHDCVCRADRSSVVWAACQNG